MLFLFLIFFHSVSFFLILSSLFPFILLFNRLWLSVPFFFEDKCTCPMYLKKLLESISSTFYWRTCANILAQIKSLTFTTSTKKLCAKLSYIKGARKMLVKLTPAVGLTQTKTEHLQNLLFLPLHNRVINSTLSCRLSPPINKKMMIIASGMWLENKLVSY